MTADTSLRTEPALVSQTGGDGPTGCSEGDLGLVALLSVGLLAAGRRWTR
jgi:hypothetical protein